MFKLFFSILYYELLLFFRDRQIIFHSLGFFVIVIMLFPLALSPHPELLKKFAPGMIWVAALLACLLALEQWLRTDLEERSLEQMLLSAYPLSWIVIAKMLAFWIAVALPLILFTPVLGVLLHLSWREIFMVSASLLVGTPALVCIGAACKTLTLSLQQQGVLLGLLVLPLTLPVLIMGINTLLQANLALPVSGSLAFLGGISLLCLCLLPIATAYTLRWGLEL